MGGPRGLAPHKTSKQSPSALPPSPASSSPPGFPAPQPRTSSFLGLGRFPLLSPTNPHLPSLQFSCL